VLGVVLGLINAATIDEFFDQLTDQELLSAEINRLFVAPGLNL
jgi:hypothetical protein